MVKWIVARLLQRYWRMTRALTMGAQGVVLDGDGRVLLVRMTYRAGWCFPGGGVEKGEHAADALARELHEEANVTLKGDAKLFGVYTNFDAFPGDHIALYIVRDWDQPHLPKPNAEIAECKWFDVDAVPDDAVDAVRARLKEILGDATQTLTW
ncbi:MAG: NUDIX domain-containing protein [Pseudomonadota bacterium]